MARSPLFLGSAALGLFVLWSNSFIAIGFLLGGDGARPRFDWMELTVARFLTAAVLCAAYLGLRRRRESLSLLRHHWRRLLVGGFLAIPGYNFALYYGQQHGVPAPVASLITALLPLFILMLAAAFLGERLTRRRVTGFLVSVLGMAIVGVSRRGEGGAAYPLLIAVTALAPLSWSLFSVASKPVVGRSPLVWTYLAIIVGTLLVTPFLPGTLYHWRALDPAGWGALLYLSVPCTVLGFAIWTWLLGNLPASTVGLTVFLNPPLTTVSKFVLSLLLPATFAFTIRAGEWLGGAVALVGLALALGIDRYRIRGRGALPGTAPGR